MQFLPLISNNVQKHNELRGDGVRDPDVRLVLMQPSLSVKSSFFMLRVSWHRAEKPMRVCVCVHQCVRLHSLVSVKTGGQGAERKRAAI